MKEKKEIKVTDHTVCPFFQSEVPKECHQG